MSEAIRNIVVVGGGTAGCVVAARVSEDPAIRTTLLEWGVNDEHVEESRYVRRWLEMLEGEYDLDYRSVPQARGNSEIRQARTKGLQAADWHEGLRQALPDWQQAVAEFAGHDGGSEALDMPTLMGSLEAMPDHGWQRQAVVSRYRLQLLRGSSVARFVQYVDERNG